MAYSELKGLDLENHELPWFVAWKNANLDATSIVIAIGTNLVAEIARTNGDRADDRAMCWKRNVLVVPFLGYVTWEVSRVGRVNARPSSMARIM